MFESVMLEKEQEELLATLVEASRNVPREERQIFLVIKTVSNRLADITHPGMPEDFPGAYMGDIEELVHQGLLRPRRRERGSIRSFDVSPHGFQYYNHLKRRQADPAKRVEKQTVEYLNADGFRREYTEAYDKWAQANDLLWSADSEEQFTTIGHLCRESIQAFATALVERFQPSDVDPIVSHDKQRVKSVLNQQSARLGKTERRYLQSLVTCWYRLSDLVQRQEHGAQRDAKSLVWEDARRVVFQAANLMFEVDRSLSRRQQQ